MKLLLHWLAVGVAETLVFCVACYQWLISPWIGPRCRFHPTCSNYAIAALRKHGPVRGMWRSLRRIARCHPWGGAGYDPP